MDYMNPSTMGTFRVAHAAHAHTPQHTPTPVPSGSKSRMGSAAPTPTTVAQPNAVPTIPLSARKAQPLDLSTVECRRPGVPHHELPPKPSRMFGLQEAPTYRPTSEEFRDPLAYISKIRPEGEQYGIVKIIPPDDWTPKFAIDTERFHFKTRRQELNSVEGGTRANLNYLDQLSKFHKQHGNNLNRFPSVDKRPLDLYKLKKAVETRGGFDRVCKQKKWAEIGRDLGYSGKIMSSLSTSLKNSYQKWLHPYEEYLRVVKPSVHQKLEMENGGPYTPSPAPSPLKKSAHGTPAANQAESPTQRASAVLHASLHNENIPTPPPEAPRPPNQGFTAVNATGFTAVNNQPQASQVASTPSSFSVANGPGAPGLYNESKASTPFKNGTTPMLSAQNTPDLRATGMTPLTNGHGSTPHKRTLSQDAESTANSETDPASGRRSKRMKKDAPTVAGSHMIQPRISTPQPFNPRVRSADERPGDRCENCGTDNEPQRILLCDSCDAGYHGYCLDPPIQGVPEYDWHCPKCLVGTGEFGFEEGAIYSLKQFQEKAHNFKEGHFANKMPYDPVTNAKRPVSEDDVEREFWRLVESITETVEVEYGADVHSTTHGSGFPTIERNPRDPYSLDPWNLNILPYHPESLFRHIKSDISGMTVPWLYVGMVFSTFCWHNEDHYTYSANYQHLGATKTWYGIPADDAEKFEQAMRDAVPELFETQPDLLFQLVTLLTPEQLKKAGVRVYAIDQRAGEFVITFPQAYHAGFNHGFNFNEAVNFAPSDWEPYGELGVQRLQDYRRQPCFSHDELLLAAATRKDMTIKSAKWLAPALERMRDQELEARGLFLEKHKAHFPHTCSIDRSTDGETPCPIQFVLDATDVPEDDLICSYCKAYSYLSRFICGKTNRVMCIRHAGVFECCPGSAEAGRFRGEGEHTLVYRMSNDELKSQVQKIVDKAGTPEAWEAKLKNILSETATPQLKTLRTVLTEGEKIDWELEGLSDLKAWVEKCSEVADEALSCTIRKQQVRRKNERPGRSSRATGKAGPSESDEKERDTRKLETLKGLLTKAGQLGFDSQEIAALRERCDSIADFQKRAQAALKNGSEQTIERLDELLEEGRSFNVDLPELELMDKVVQQLRWFKDAQDMKALSTTLQDVIQFIQRGRELGISENHPEIQHFHDKKAQGELWESKAKELMSVENVHYQQLDALSKQATSIPVSAETLAKVDAILKKQRDAQNLICTLFERTKDPDYRKRPRYKEVKDAMEDLSELNHRPPGTLDLEKEQRRHEDWMRRGKKLFGKANAPLHILHAHMKLVDERNKACFDLSDQPRMPIEPASREASPADEEPGNESGSSRDVFCICRRPEAGMMIECELCHEWYHGKCFKLARGKVKEDDKYTCPICDYRVKIPRDATRPKLEDLMAWEDEIPNLPLQPEEEETLRSIIEHGQRFRDYVSQYINPIMSSPEEIVTQRFYLRKLEGADILLAPEINFFRAELHKWAPVAPNPPPPISVSLSTRKPRPTKQQKLMKEYGVANPDELPPSVRPKPTFNNKSRQASDAEQQHQQQQHQGFATAGGIHHTSTEQSHTPPGDPPDVRQDFASSAAEQSYFPHPNSHASASGAYAHAGPHSPPTFSTNATLNFANASSVPPIDPGLFESPGAHSGAQRQPSPPSPIRDMFKSSGSGTEMFGDHILEEPVGGGQAEEALAQVSLERGEAGASLGANGGYLD